MAFTVAQLLATPALATRAVAGRSGIDRIIGWAHVCELPTPWLWVGRGDLLMTTGIGVPADPADQVRYVEELAEVGAAAVAIGEDMHAPPLSPEMRAASDDVGLPVLLTRRDIPFVALARTIAADSQRDQQARIDQTVKVYELLRQSSLHEVGLADLLCSLEQVVGCGLLAADGVTGETLVPGTPFPVLLQQAVAHWRSHQEDERPLLVQGEVGEKTSVLLPVPGPRPAVLAAVEQDAGLPDATVLRHVAAVTALQQTWLYAERERARRLGASLLAQLVDDQLDRSVARSQLAERGLGERQLVLAACRQLEADDELHHLHHVLGDAAVPHLMLARRGTTYVLLPGEGKALRILADALPSGWATGVSGPVTDTATIPAALREASWSLRRATDRGLPVVWHSDGLADSLFLPGRREDSIEAARRVLGAVLDYEAAHGIELVLSLQVFLEENRSWQRAAARLHIHKQTLVYRMGRVEELSGRSLSSTADVAELWLALRSAVGAALVDL